ncbi:DMT family transporter [Streptomyces sp. DH20]|uniref:DMT family transporter n=1 Tax=Streptomyces sp. DH20 TaxID=2857009 RepID=UPI001E387A57|nr:EamA family transporter [Streptomyces sp. DH20]
MRFDSAARFAAVALMWGSSYFWIKIVFGGLNSAQFSFFRILVGAVAMLGILALGRERLPRGAGVWARLVLIAFLANALPVLLVELVDDAVGADADMVSVFNASVPLCVVLLCLAARRADRVPARVAAGLVVGFAGVLVLYAPWGAEWLSAGAAVNAAAAVAYGWSMLLMEKLMGPAEEGGRAMTPLVLATTQAVIGVGWAGINMPNGGFDSTPHFSASIIGALLVLGVLNTGLVYMCFAWLIREEGAAKASGVLYAVPVVLTLGMVLLEDHVLGTREILGMAVIVAGLILTRLPQRTAPAGRPRSADRATPAAKSPAAVR